MRRLKVDDNYNEVDAYANPYPDRPGEPDCIYYIKTGSCGYGSTCRYNHPTYVRPVRLILIDLPTGNLTVFLYYKFIWDVLGLFNFVRVCLQIYIPCTLVFKIYCIIMPMHWFLQGTRVKGELPERVGQPDCQVNHLDLVNFLLCFYVLWWEECLL